MQGRIRVKNMSLTVVIASEDGSEQQLISLSLPELKADFRTCPDCNGTGYTQGTKPCQRCGGVGTLTAVLSQNEEWKWIEKEKHDDGGG